MYVTTGRRVYTYDLVHLQNWFDTGVDFIPDDPAVSLSAKQLSRVATWYEQYIRTQRTQRGARRRRASPSPAVLPAVSVVKATTVEDLRGSVRMYVDRPPRGLPVPSECLIGTGVPVHPVYVMVGVHVYTYDLEALYNWIKIRNKLPGPEVALLPHQLAKLTRLYRKRVDPRAAALTSAGEGQYIDNIGLGDYGAAVADYGVGYDAHHVRAEDIPPWWPEQWVGGGPWAARPVLDRHHRGRNRRASPAFVDLTLDDDEVPAPASVVVAEEVESDDRDDDDTDIDEEHLPDEVRVAVPDKRTRLV